MLSHVLLDHKLGVGSFPRNAILKCRVGGLPQVLVASLAALTLAAQAFTLGDLRGTAVIGRVLDVSVKFQSGADDDISLNCIKADVYFADSRQTSPHMTLSAGVDNAAAVRIVSAGIVNEPVVTVLVRFTCGSSTMRRYVLLADFPSVAEVTVLPAPAAARASMPMSLSAGSDLAPVLVLPTLAEPVPLAQPATAADKHLIEPKKLHRPRSLKSKVAEPSEVVQSKVSSKAAKPSGKSLLKLDPLDFLSDRMDSLDSSLLFAPTEDAIKQTQQIASLQTEVKLLRDLALKSDARLADLQLKLEQAQVPSYTVWLLYVLLALVILCLGAIAWLWHKQRKGQEFVPAAWWQDSDDEDNLSTLLMPQPAGTRATAGSDRPVAARKPLNAQQPVSTIPPVELTAAVTEPSPSPATMPADLHEVDLDIDLGAFMMPEIAPQLPPILELESESAASVAPLAAEPAAPLSPKSVHRIGTELIQDIRQQAEFFVSLGQTDRALEILKAQIGQSPEPNPLVYLDALALYHSLGLQADFREQRDRFAQLFNVAVPDFPAFSLEGKDLDDYPEVLADLVSLWTSPQALVFLDQCIFYDPQAQLRPMFDLAAARSLLLLHTLAEELTPQDQPPALPLVFNPAAPVMLAPQEEASALDDDFAKAFVVDLALLPQAPTAASAPDFDQQAEFSLPDLPVPSETPSRMLDLDFSSLELPTADVPVVSDDTEPIIQPPVPYATRARWPVAKKPK